MRHGRWRDTAIASLIGLLSLLLLIYAGLGEAYRTYPGFVVKSLASQGQVVQDAVNRFVSSGLPVQDFPGMDTMATTLLATNAKIARVGVDDAHGKPIFAKAAAGQEAHAREPFTPSALKLDDARFGLEESDHYYRVRLPLRNRFEALGSLRLDLSREHVRDAVGSAFQWVWGAGAFLLLVYTAFAHFVSAPAREGGNDRAGRAVGMAYGATYLVMAAVVVASLVTLYSGAIQAKTQAMGASLAGRLEPAFALGLDLPDFSGVDETFSAYKRLDPDLGYACLTAGGHYLIGTDPAPAGTWAPPVGHFNFDTPLAGGSRVLHVGVRATVVYRALWRSVKNFLVLFVALGFLAALFFNFRTLLAERGEGQTAFELGTVRPLYFLAVFMEGLASSFLPPYFAALATASHLSAHLVASLFTTYFLAFVAALLPAGQFARARGPRPLVLAGALLGAVGMAIAGSGAPFMLMYLARAVSGFGQGLLLVGIEAYILRFARAGQRTQASTIIVYGYNGGMISGGAIGALLAVYMGTRWVLVVGAAIGVLTWLFGLVFLQKEPVDAEKLAVGPGAGGNLLASLRRCLADGEFTRTTLLVGIPSKAVLTGVTIFAAPLLLARQGYLPEDVGQILMCYAAGVLLSSRRVARAVDASGATGRFLTVGVLGSAIGLAILSLLGTAGSWSLLAPALPAVGLFTLGLAHGFINAPVVTHIAKTDAARDLGGPVAGSLYRFLERAGHVSGPLVVAQILIAAGGPPAMAWLAAAIGVTGLLYMLTLRRVAPGASQEAA